MKSPTAGPCWRSFFFSSRRRHTRYWRDWSSDVCSSDLVYVLQGATRDALVDKVCAAHDAVYADPALAAEYREEYDYYPTKWVSPYIDRQIGRASCRERV